MDQDADHQSALVLFDPMTHTPNGYADFVCTATSTHFLLSQSGLGDHSFSGFQDFIDDHKCNPLCRDLDLSAREVLQATLNEEKKLAESYESD
jgi:hypothetical protein